VILTGHVDNTIVTSFAGYLVQGRSGHPSAVPGLGDHHH